MAEVDRSEHGAPPAPRPEGHPYSDDGTVWAIGRQVDGPAPAWLRRVRAALEARCGERRERSARSMARRPGRISARCACGGAPTAHLRAAISARRSPTLLG